MRSNHIVSVAAESPQAAVPVVAPVAGFPSQEGDERTLSRSVHRDAIKLGAASEATTYQRITDQVMAALERGDVPWTKPWVSHQNIDGRAYRGINPWLLELEGHKSPYWLTAKQIEGFREAGQDLRLDRDAKPAAAYFWMNRDQASVMKPLVREALLSSDADVIARARLVHDYLVNCDQPDQQGRMVGTQGYRQTVFDDGWVARVRGPMGNQPGDVALGHPEQPGHWHVTMGTKPTVAWYGHAHPLPVGTAAIPWDPSLDPESGSGVDLFRRAQGHEKDRAGETTKGTGPARSVPILRSYVIYNCDDISGWDYTKLAPAIADRLHAKPMTPDREAALAAGESIIAAMPNRPGLDTTATRAFYRPSEDKVYLPPRERFTDLTRYYEVAFHELGHSTGHETRLGRDLTGLANGSHEERAMYSREELVAEMTASYLMGKAGLLSDHAVAQAATYLKSWGSYLKSDPKAMVVAAAQAQKAADFILGVSAPADEGSPF